jgi:hypothetical protein
VTRSIGGAWAAPAAGSAKPLPATAVARQAGPLAIAAAADARGVLRIATARHAVWAAPITVAEHAGETGAALAASGRAIVAWRQAGRRIRAAGLAPDGTLEAPRDLGSAPQLRGGPYAAVNDAGDAVVAWVRSVRGRGRVLLVSVRRAGGDWSGPAALSGAPKAIGGVAVGVDVRGTALILWSQGGLQSEPSTRRIAVAERPLGAPAWGAPTTLHHGYGGSVALEVDGEGGALAVWGPAFQAQLQTAARPPGGAWRRTGPVPGSRCCVDALAVSPLGDAFLVSSAGRVFSERVWRRPAGSARWRLAPEGVIGLPADRLLLSVNPAGDAAVGWHAGQGHTSMPVWAAAFEAPPRAALRSLRVRMAPDGRPRIALDVSAAGRVLLSVRRAGGGRVVDAAVVRVAAGRTTLALPPRLQRSLMRPGRYVVRADSGGREPRTAIREAALSVR